MDDDDYPRSEPRPRVILARGPKEEIFEYALMLASQGVKHWTEFDGNEYSLTLDAGDFPLASQLLDLYRADHGQRAELNFRLHAASRDHQ